MRRRRFHGWMAAACTLAVAAEARALVPEDIVVVFNSHSPNSLRVARYYMNARKIPPDHIIAVSCEATEALTEELYRTSFVPQVRRGLQEAKLAGSVKCLVTVYDVPLRILARQPSAAEQAEIGQYQKELDATLTALEKEIPSFDAILRAPATAPATAPTTTAATHPAEPHTFQTILQRLGAAATALAGRIDRTPDPARTVAINQFIAVEERVAGAAGLLNTIQVNGGDATAADAVRKQIATLTSQLHEVDQRLQTLQRHEDQPEVRREMITLSLKSQGLLGQARMLEAMIAYLRPDNTESCLDSELTLVLNDQNYPRVNWVVNPLNIEVFSSIKAPPQGSSPPLLMVTRLDGLTPAKVEEMIDTTLATEAKGLDGKLYLDARGMHGTDPYAVFDADIRLTADWLKQHSTIDVVLEDTSALLAAKDAPQCALYCGWYSLENYQDSAQWVPGAVGYHVASLEMLSLHNPKETGWVPNLLKHGFCGTLGATDEPYLSAFPKPSLFFPLLLSGEFTQGEVFQVTSPMLSWRIGFVGDPLYNPYKTKPQVKIEDLKAHPILRNAFTILRDSATTKNPAKIP